MTIKDDLFYHLLSSAARLAANLYRLDAENKEIVLRYLAWS